MVVMVQHQEDLQVLVILLLLVQFKDMLEDLVDQGKEQAAAVVLVDKVVQDLQLIEVVLVVLDNL